VRRPGLEKKPYLSHLTKFQNNFISIYMRSLCAKFQLSSFKTEGGDRGHRRSRKIEMKAVPER